MDKASSDVAMTEDTIASPQGADAPTDLHEPVEVELALAYSEESDQEDSGRRGWFVVPVFVVALLGFAAAVGVGCWLWVDTHHDKAAVLAAAPVPTTAPVVLSTINTGEPLPPPKMADPPPTALPAPTATVTVAPSTVAAPPPPQLLPPPRPSQADQDRQFLAAMTNARMGITDVGEAIEGGHDNCAYLAMGHSESDAVAAAMHNNATMAPWQAWAFVNAAVRIYCPEQAD
jgi:hypothetical protein